MSGARQWIGKIFLRTPAPLHAIRRLPIVGGWIHWLSHAVLPASERHWAQIQLGPAKGLWLELNPRTGTNYLRGEAEDRVQKTLVERLRPGMVFYDLGANIGLFSLLAARIVGAKGHVFSFEPDSIVATRLRSNIARNRFSNVTVIEKGVWSSSGEVNFVPADTSSPDRGTGRFVAEQSETAVPLKCLALDDFVADHPPPHAIKCDVEGAELEAMHGAEKLIRAHRPWILGEMHSDANARAWRQFLIRFGYLLEAVDGNHIFASP
ncbi:MAG: FkbM family methyltransferase [Candidatus Acidiferrales bacterium]